MSKKIKKVAKGNLEQIQSFLESKLDWISRAAKKEKETGELTEINLSAFLNRELERSVDLDEQAYAEALGARTYDQRHAAILSIIQARKTALVGTTAEVSEEGEEPVLEEEMDDELKAPRKKGYLELTFDSLCESYEKTPSEEIQLEVLDLISKLEVNRRVRFLYDLQKLRIGAKNRSLIYSQQFGVQDIFIDYAGNQMERLERHNERMVDRILKRSAEQEFYAYLTETYLGLGTMMAGCLISELSSPERFRSVSALWAYCGLKVVGNDPETGHGGYAQRRERGEAAGWNHFLRTKLLGVLSGCMIKAQTRHIGTDQEAAQAPNVKILNDYKSRLHTQNELIPERDRAYNAKGKEVFQYRSIKPVIVCDKDGNQIGSRNPSQLRRRSKGHINKMAVRYMMKMFLADILNQWRSIKGYEPFLTYDEAKLRNGVPHQGTNLHRVVPAVPGRVRT